MSNEMQQQWETSWLDSGNQSYLDEQYEAFLKNPADLPEEWRKYFTSLFDGKSSTDDVSHAEIKEYFKKLSYKTRETTSQVPVDQELRQIAVGKLISAYRLLGHLISKTNPLENLRPMPIIPELELSTYNLHTLDLNTVLDAGNLAGNKNRPLNQIIQDLHAVYCGAVGSEYMHILDSEERNWVREQLENRILNLQLNNDEKLRILELVIAADGLEKYIGAKYPGAKRFSIEGCDSLIVALDKIIVASAKQSTEEIILAMAHRGRLNVLVNLLGKMPRELFDQFEDKLSMDVETGDVKYHQGFASDLEFDGKIVHVSLAFNPSHLEIVTPVATGSARARQERRNDTMRNKVICIAMHGDAAFAGQGIVMETLNMSGTRGFSVGGTIHIIVNNQIGFTTSNPKDARSTLYSSDVAKMLGVPIFHVNADAPEMMSVIAELALDYRLKFNKDVIIDLVGYRRMGHNEADEPSATQPVMYKSIRSHPTLRELYATKIVAEQVCTTDSVENFVADYRSMLDKRDKSVVKHLASRTRKNEFASDWSPYGVRDWRLPYTTKVELTTLQALANKRDNIPDGFVLNPRVKKIVEDRLKMTTGELPVDWGYAETLAYASLLNEGYAVRLSGQDCGRGTFFHRHAVWHEQNTGQAYISLANLSDHQGKFWVIDSLLSEAGVLGFEYGFSTSEPKALTLWEAQFGDFANGAQVVIDQFISSGEQKWGRLSGLVMLLPHGYEGQGPEHSSARLERYLQLCAQHNIQVCVPSTPAQVYHMLRRQLLRPIRKPLITITPKSLLRHKAATSSLDELANGSFHLVIGDSTVKPENVSRVILCSGKIYYELDEERKKLKLDTIAILRIEQLYPFPEEELVQELKKFDKAQTIVWCQEEPRNQGAWYSTQHHLRHALSPEQKLLYAGRGDSAAPAVGYYKLHEEQQVLLVKEAIGME